MIRPITTSDVESICDIYNHYIENSTISFEYETVSLQTMQARIENTTRQYPWFVYEEQGVVLAYAYANQWKAREAYQYVLETTVYASHQLTTRGVGTQLYQALIEALSNDPKYKKIKALMGVIALPNDASVALHKKMGFVEAGYFKEVGFKFDKWIDVAYYLKDLK